MSAHESTTLPFDAHTEPHHNVTTGQLTLFTIWIGAGFIWLIRFMKSSSSSVNHTSNHTEKPLLNDVGHDVGNNTNDAVVETKVDVERGGDKSVADSKNGDKTVRNFSAVKPPPTIDELLQAILVFGMIMIFFYLCDYRKVCIFSQSN